MYEKNKVCAKISISNIKHNYNLAKKVANGKSVIAVVKANAYGHGAIEVARALYEDCGCRWFAVANLDEAVSLRKSGIGGMILVLAYTNPQSFDYLLEYDISQAISSIEYLKEICSFADNKKEIKLHIKIETGMNRTGFCFENALLLKEAADILKNNKNLVCEGIFTHFAESEIEDTSFTKLQYQRFCSAKNVFTQNGLSFEHTHTCNTAGIFNHSYAHFDTVRFGIGLYGFGVGNGLLPAMEFSASITALHKVKEGDSISYNRTFFAKNDMLIATICAGYADGLRRALSGKANVLINGKLCPIVGRVCMDMTMVDVSSLEGNVKIGDRAEIFGNNISCEDVARICDTISYELLCSVSPRVPRIYSDF